MAKIVFFILVNLVASFCLALTPEEYRTKYQNECLKDNKINSCIEAGRSTSFSPDILFAKTYYLRACNLGSTYACNQAFEPEKIIKQSEKDKIKCDTKNDAEACNEYGAFMSYTNPNSPDGDNYRLKACNLKDSSACYVLGYDYENRKQYDKAFEVYTKACDMNDQVGCRWAAFIELDHRDNFDKGIELLSKACFEKKMETACYNGGMELMKRQKYVEAEKLMGRSVQLKQRGSKYRLREITEFAILERDLNTRRPSQKISCEKALAESFTALALEDNKYSVNNEENKQLAKKNFTLLHRKRECGANILENDKAYIWHTDSYKATLPEYKNYKGPSPNQ